MKLVVCALFVQVLMLPVSAHADTTNKEHLIRFAKAVGIYEQLAEQKVAIQARGEQTAKQYAEQIAASTPGLPDQFRKDMEYEMKAFMSSIADLIDTDFAVDSYVELISRKLTPDEIQEITKFYESELGKKYIRSNTEIMGDWTAAFMGDFDQKMAGHLQSFVNNLMAKASTYNEVQ